VNTADELKTIFHHLKRWVSFQKDAGLPPPHLPLLTRKYLDAERFAPISQATVPGSLDLLRHSLGECTLCRLHSGRTHLVFGEGSPRARLVFVGEGPGREEDQTGRPFVGEAGKLLDRIIQAMGLTREEVYISNVVKCRPPDNRDPEKEEVSRCLPFLQRQLSMIQPEAICTLGRVAGCALLGEGFRITEERGKWRSYMGVPLLPTYHPAFLLRNPSAKRQVWEDVQEIMRRLNKEAKDA
jgi:uracil-DNA glycosylase